MQTQLQVVHRRRRVGREFDAQAFLGLGAPEVGEEAGQTGRHLVHAAPVGVAHLAQLGFRFGKVEGRFGDLHEEFREW